MLNNRGLDLSHSDILKSEIIGKIPQADQARYGKKWEDTEEMLGRQAFANLFSHIRTIFRKVKPKETVLAEFRQYVMGQVAESKKLLDEVVFPFAAAYADIADASYESASKADEINRLLKWLGRIDNKDWVPAAILFMAKNANDAAALHRFIADLERLAATLMIIRAPINDRIERYAKVIGAIEQGEDLYKKDSPLQISGGEGKEAISELNGDVYTMIPSLRLYILLRLDSNLSGGGATYEYDLITTEHVLPQSPAAGSQWEKWFPNPSQRAKVVHRLGNLALLTRRKNSSAQNFEFDQKKLNYFVKNGVSPFAITTQVINEKEWTPALVEKRQGELLEALVRVWRLK